MKLTDEIKAKITQDWAGLLPGLGVYQPMRLLRRVGPLLSGICLDRDSGNEAYRPTFHVHCLATPFPTVSLTLAQYLLTERTGAPDTIRAMFHDKRYAEACARLQRQASLPLSGPLSSDQVLEAYRRHMQTPLERYPLLLYEDIIAILAWCNRPEEATASLKNFVNDIRSWHSSINVVQHAGGVDQWASRCQSWIDNPDFLRTTVEREVIKLEADYLPVAEFFCE